MKNLVFKILKKSGIWLRFARRVVLSRFALGCIISVCSGSYPLGALFFGPVHCLFWVFSVPSLNLNLIFLASRGLILGFILMLGPVHC